MSKFFSFAKRTFSVSVAAATILWSVGIAAFVPVATQAAQAGDLIKQADLSGVYYYGADGNRYTFPNGTTYNTWYTDFSSVKTIPATELQAIRLAGNVTFRPGTYLVKITTDPAVYAVEPGGVLRWITTESIAQTLYGPNWAKMVRDVPDQLFPNYSFGSDITTNMYPTGTVISNGGSNYYVDGSSKRMITSAGFTANNFQSAFVVAAPDSVANALSTGSQITGFESGIWNVSGGAGVQPNTGNVAASLSADSPSSKVLVTGQALADLAHFTFSGSGTVTSVTLERIGVSANTTPSAVFLFDGETRITDSASFSSDNTLTVAGLNIAVNGSKTVSVRSNIASSTAGETVGVKLVSFKVGSTTVTSGATGSIHSIASATPATVAVASATGSGNADPGTDINVWQGTVTVGTRDVNLTRLAVRQIGSINKTDIQNFRLLIDGVQVAQTQSIDADGYVTFTTNTTVKTGARIFKVLADVVGGSGRTVQMSLRGAYDINATDTSYGVTVLATGTFPFGPSAFTVNAGTLSVQKASDSPSATVIAGGSDIPVARYTFTAYGEPVKVETLTVGVDVTGATDANVTFRNGRVLVDGSQVGSTTDIAAASSHGSGQSFTTNFYVYPGTPRTVEVRADMYDSEGTEEIAAGTVTSFQFGLLAGSSNGVPQVSLTPINVPTALTTANAVSNATGSISLAATTTYPAQTTVSPRSNYKLGSFTLTGNASEAVNVNTLTLDITVGQVAGTPTIADVTDVYIKYGSTMTPIKPTVSATSNTWSVNIDVPVGGSQVFEVYGNFNSDFEGTDTILTKLLVSGTTAVSGTSVSTNSGSTLSGQTITMGTGSITGTLDASSPVAKLVDDSGTVQTAAFKFETVSDSYTITDMTLTVVNATAVSQVAIKDGTTTVATKPGATSLTFNNLNIAVPANSSKVLTVELTLSSVGVGAGTSDVAITTAMTAFTARNSNGTSAAGTESNPSGNAMYIYKAVPLLTQVALPTTALTAGGASYTIAKFTVSSNGTGTVAWKEVLLEIAKPGGGTDGDDSTPTVTSVTLWNADTNTQITAAALIQNADGTSASTCAESDSSCEVVLTVGAKSDDNVEEQVSGAKTYEVRATIGGTLATNDFVTTKIDNNTTSHAAAAVFTTNDAGTGANSTSFTWSDVSAQSHDTGTADWLKDYLIKTLPMTWSIVK